MEYGKLIKDALGLAWRKRYLWVFGFFAGAGSPNIDNKMAAEKLGDAWEWAAANPGLVAVLLLAALALGLVFWVLQVVSQGSLVRGASDAEQGMESGFETALSHGLRSFWPVLGLQLLLIAAIVGAVALTAGPPIMMVIFGGTGVKVLGVAWLVAAAIPLLAGLVTAGLIWNYSLRFCVLHRQRVFQSIGSSWSLIKCDFSESVILFAIGLGIGLALGLAVVLALIVLAIPFVILGIINLALGLVPGLLIGVPAFILSICILGVFQSAYWTLGFMRLPSIRCRPPEPTEP
jgi:hypothetical protein